MVKKKSLSQKIESKVSKFAKQTSKFKPQKAELLFGGQTITIKKSKPKKAKAEDVFFS